MTTEPNKEMREIHNRMPIILHHEDEMKWVTTSASVDIEDLLVPLEDNSLEMYPIATEVNSVKNNYPEIITKL